MYKATEEIYEAFQDAELHCETDENDEGHTYVRAGISTKLTSFSMLFISTDDDNDVSMRIFNFVRFDEEKRGSVLFAANKLNRMFRYVKFFVDFDDNTVTVAMDFPVSCDNVGQTAIEILFRMMDISDEAYSEFMKAIWAS